MKKNAPTTINESVMKQIKNGRVHMKPRAYYTLLAVLTVGIVGLAGLAMAYLWSIVFLWIRIETATTPARGARTNLADTIATFPWWALIASALLLAVAVALVRRQGHLYRHRIVTITLIVLLCSLLIGMGLSAFDVGRSHTPGRFDNGQAGRGQMMQRNYN